MGNIVSIVYKPEGVQDSYDSYLRVPLPSATLVANYGIEGDAKGGNPVRNLNLMARETLDSLSALGFATAPGQMGEQIVVQGIDFSALQPGDRLQLGDAVVIEITKPRTGCDKFEHVQSLKRPAPPEMGMMAKVLVGGTIRESDPVVVLEPTSQAN
jgi:MOSC domain-containing protein YiiM